MVSLTSFICLLICPFPAFRVALLLSPPPSLPFSILVRLALYLTFFLMDGVHTHTGSQEETNESLIENEQLTLYHAL